MNNFQRFVIYQRERFPLAKTVPLLAVFSAASINVSAVLASRPLPALTWYGVGFLLSLILFFQMRAADEWKDLDADRLYRPERPIPSGLVKLRTILLVALGLAPIALLAAFGISNGVAALLGLVWLWLVAMTFEFGLSRWLIANPVFYLLSHMAIMPLIDLLLTGIEWSSHGGPEPALSVFLALSFVNGCVLEIGRKTWAPESEREGVETYSRLWGSRNAACVWLTLLTGAASLLLAMGWALDVFPAMAAVCLVIWTLSAIVALRFVREPSIALQKRIDTIAGIWVLVSYGSAGFLPLLLGGAS